jgi:hypothetical protein
MDSSQRAERRRSCHGSETHFEEVQFDVFLRETAGRQEDRRHRHHHHQDLISANHFPLEAVVFLSQSEEEKNFPRIFFSEESKKDRVQMTSWLGLLLLLAL